MYRLSLHETSVNSTENLLKVLTNIHITGSDRPAMLAEV